VTAVQRHVGRPRAPHEIRTDPLEPIDAWCEWMRAAGAPQTSIGLRRYYVMRLWQDFPDLLAVGVDDLARWMGSAQWAANTKKSARSSLRSFYGWAVATGRLSVSPAAQLPAVRIPRAAPRPTPERAFAVAVAVADARARLAIMLAGYCGLRRGEIVRVHSDHIVEDGDGWSLRVVGKGGHVRYVPLPPVLAGELHSLPRGYAFPSPRGGHLTPHHLAKIVTRHLPAGVSTHTLRHRCATVAYAGTRDLRAVQELLGHSRPETTAGYAYVPQNAVRAAMQAAAHYG
jgi:integrase/recombinase XerC